MIPVPRISRCCSISSSQAIIGGGDGVSGSNAGLVDWLAFFLVCVGGLVLDVHSGQLLGLVHVESTASLP